MGAAPQYQLPYLRYGMGAIYRGSWTAPPAPGSGDFVHYGASIKLFDTSDTQIAEFSSDAQDSRLASLTFALMPTGPAEFDIEVADPSIALAHAYRIDVRLWGHADPIYSGFFQKIPGRGTTEFPLKGSGFGFYKFLQDLTYNADFQAQSVWRVVDTLARDMESRSRIVYNGGKIVQDPRSLYVMNEIKFLRAPMLTAIQTLADLAGGFEFGVDARREFFFRPPVTAIADDSRLWVGKNLATFINASDSTGLKNRLWIRSGKRNTTGDNYLPFSVEDKASQAAYGLREDSWDAPTIFADADAYRAAAVQLYDIKDPLATGQVTGIDLQPNSLINCAGFCQVTDNNGNSAPFSKAKVVYKVDGKGIVVDMDLGVIKPTSLQGLFSEMKARQAQQELIYNLSMQQRGP